MGHLFQNRYKSIVVEEEPYLLALVRYLHLDPLRAKVVPDLRRLARFPWTGQSALLGTVPRPWQDTQTILAQFGPIPRRAVAVYRAFMKAGLPPGRRPELQGGGLLRSHGGWAAVTVLRRGREAYQGDERILGSSVCRAVPARGAAPRSRLALAALVARVCQHVGMPPAHLTAGNRLPAATRARAGIAYPWVARLGHPGRPLAVVLGVRPQAVYQAVARGRAARAEWDQLLGD
ncbi:MAG TPA: hypothetical protein VF579_10120 [Candidatus Methylomirabilis sp.]